MSGLTQYQEIIFSDQKRDNIRYLLLNISYSRNSYNNDLTSLRKNSVNLLPEVLLDIIFNFEGTFDPPPAIIFRNIPTDPQLPPTPYCSNSVEGKIRT